MTEGSLSPLRDAAAAFADLIRGLPSEALAAQEWGPREVLAHLVFCFENYVSYLQAAAEGRRPQWFKGTVAEHNARAVAKFAGVPVATLLQRFEAAVREFATLASRPDLQTMQFRTRAGSAPKQLAEVIPMMPGHIVGHTRALVRLREFKSNS